MKKNLLAGGSFVFLAMLGMGSVVMLALTQEARSPRTIAPQTEPIAALPTAGGAVPVKKELPRLARAERVPDVPMIKTKPEVRTPAPPEAPPMPKTEAKIVKEKEAKKQATPIAKKPESVKAIVLGNVIKLNDPNGAYAVKPLHGKQEMTLLGRIKTLTIAAVDDRAVLDATRLVADEIELTNDLNGAVKVLLGKARSLKIRSLNDQALLDAGELHAEHIFLTGAVNSRATLKLHAPKGLVGVHGEINDRAQIDIAAEGGKAIFKNRGASIINGNAKLTILAKDLDLRGVINGAQLQVTLSNGGSLKFRRLSAGTRLIFSKAAAGDPPLRIERGEIDARAVFRETPAGRR